MGSINPDIFQCNHNGQSRTDQMEPSALGGLSYLSYLREFICRSRYETLSTGLSFDPLSFPLCPVAHVDCMGCTMRTRDTNPTMGLTG